MKLFTSHFRKVSPIKGNNEIAFQIFSAPKFKIIVHFSVNLTFKAFCWDVHFQCFQCMSLLSCKRKMLHFLFVQYSKTCLKEDQKLVFKTDYCLMQVKSPREHSAILSTFIKLPFVFKILVLSIFGWPLKKGFTLYY